MHLPFKPGKANNDESKGIAGIYRITATSERFPMRKAEVAVEAKVDGLTRLDGNTNYVDDISAVGHTSGDNATVATKQRIAQFAGDFHDAQVEHDKQLTACLATQWPIYPLWVIDISLPFGGLYDDIHRDWSTPHQTHGRGDGVDFSVHPRFSGGKLLFQAWPDEDATTRVCGGITVSTQFWLMMKMAEVGMNYGHWDSWDLCHDPPTCSNDPAWHLHVDQ